MIIAIDTTWADASDHDPSFRISDGENSIGFIIKVMLIPHLHASQMKSITYPQILCSIILVQNQTLHWDFPVSLIFR